MSYLKVWANADREESYIKRMLDIDHGDSYYNYYYKHMSTSWKPENEIKGHTNYVYLQNYRELRKRMWS
ncbi:hypothetical protein PHMEG_00011008 [Phytophthora megakarya]|uniref:RxLR effector protein n=1 Tax=Phytophthora megakarya TaxID=4795 RepID=A0A225WC90_9STRA|nr:hypothetical protein PHMEG_00011008 [Phytophthora megakarya]